MFQSLFVGRFLRTSIALVLIAIAHAATAATNIVTTTADDNSPGSLRYLIAHSAPGDTITFAPALSGTTIVLTNSRLTLYNSLNIDASALPGGIQINGNHQDLVFSVYYYSGGTSVFTGLTITNGYANGTTYSAPFNGDGGGVYNHVSTVILNRCTVAGNTANPYPGGLFPPGQGGGGIANLGTMTLNDCTIAGNSAAGGAVFNGGLLTVNNSTLSGSAGYAIENGQTCPKFCGTSSALVIVNQSTLSGNAGGISSVSTNAVIINQSTISGNSGAGLSGLFTVTNSIIAGNGSTGGTLINSVYNVIGATPNLSPLGNYGGLTQTMPPLLGSPALDSGTDITTNTFATDQRGSPRLSGLHVDCGAVESAFAPSAPLATTQPATGLGPTTATLNATVTQNGALATSYFQFGTTTNYGTDIPVPAFSVGTASVSNNLTGLPQGH